MRTNTHTHTHTLLIKTMCLLYLVGWNLPRYYTSLLTQELNYFVNNEIFICSLFEYSDSRIRFCRTKSISNTWMSNLYDQENIFARNPLFLIDYIHFSSTDLQDWRNSCQHLLKWFNTFLLSLLIIHSYDYIITLSWSTLIVSLTLYTMCF